MTPKEKAKELVEKYNNLLQKEITCIVYLQSAKQCAIIAVDEILNTYPTMYDQPLYSNQIEDIKFWQEVKQEIELL